MARGHFYPPPPPFIGGRQPYAPALGQPQSGPVPQAPPPRSLVNFDVIRASWVAKPYPQPQYAEIAPLVPAAVAAAGPPPVSRVWLNTVADSYRDRQWTLIYVASIAPILSTPETISQPPPVSQAAFNSIISQWQPVPNRPPPLKGVGAFSVAVVPDAPPPNSYANLNQIRTQWNAKPWWPLPALKGVGQFSVVVPPSPPPPVTLQTYKLIIDSWKPPTFYSKTDIAADAQVFGVPQPGILETIPYLIGAEEYSARIMLEAIHMVVSVIGSGGTVVSQSVDAFTLAERGTTVVITMGGATNVPRRHRRHGQIPYNRY